MKRYIYAILASAIGFVSAGCSDTDTEADPFTGKDNFLFSLVLHIGDTELPARIIGEQVSLTVPAGISLDRAEATYELSELATIVPNPDDVTDWSAEQIFVVTSYSGEKRTYTYACIESDTVYEGDVTLKSQSEVEAFGLLAPEVIEGSLTVGAVNGETISDISALAGIREIRGNLLINNSVRCERFEMPELERIDALRIGSAETTAENNPAIGALAFPVLTDINGDCKIFYVNDLKTVSMPALRRIGGDLFLSGVNPSLSFDDLEETQHIYMQNIQIDICFPKLHSAANIQILSNQREIDLPLLETAGNIVFSSDVVLCPRLQKCASLETSSRTNDFSSLEEVFTDLLLSYAANDGASLLVPSLTAVGGMLTVQSWMWESFPALRRLGGVTVYDSGFNAAELDTIDLAQYEMGNLGIYLSLSIETLIGPDEYGGELMTRAKTVKGFRTVKSLDIAGCTSNEFECVKENCVVNDMDCPVLQSVGRDMTVNGSCSLPVLHSVGRKLNLYPTTAEYALPALEEVGDGSLSATAHCLAIGEDGYLPTLEKIEFPVLKRILGMVYMNPDGDLIGLKTISAPLLEQIEGALYIGRTPRYNPSNCSVLETVDFPRLQSVTSVEINYNPFLKDFTSFRNVVGALKESRWKTSNNGYNPTLQDMLNGKYIGE